LHLFVLDNLCNVNQRLKVLHFGHLKCRIVSMTTFIIIIMTLQLTELSDRHFTVHLYI